MQKTSKFWKIMQKCVEYEELYNSMQDLTGMLWPSRAVPFYESRTANILSIYVKQAWTTG